MGDTVTSAKDPLTLNPKLKLKLNPTTDTDTVDTMVDTVDTMAVDTTGVEWILLVKMLKKPLNYLQDQVTRILSIWLLFPPFFDEKCLFFTIISSNDVYL